MEGNVLNQPQFTYPTFSRGPPRAAVYYMNENLPRSAHSSLASRRDPFIRAGEGPGFRLSDFMRQHHRAQDFSFGWNVFST